MFISQDQCFGSIEPRRSPVKISLIATIVTSSMQVLPKQRLGYLSLEFGIELV